MDLVPIKLIKNRNVRNTLLRVKGENAEIDTSDYIERKMNTNLAARYLMAIEDASEMAKQLIQRPGVFEQIAKDIKKEADYDFKFRCRRTSNMTKPAKNRKGTEYLHISHTYESGDGHYALAKVNHNKNEITLFIQWARVSPEFRNELRTVYGNYLHIKKQKLFLPTDGWICDHEHKKLQTAS
jgi:hypothetical protein